MMDLGLQKILDFCNKSKPFYCNDVKEILLEFDKLKKDFENLKVKHKKEVEEKLRK